MAAQGNVFISYVREDSAIVDRLQLALEAAGIPVWRDITHLPLGLDWRSQIRTAITDGALAFLACFSDVAVSRERTEQRTELLLAITEYRRRQPDRPWLLPVRLTECRLPHFDLGADRTLADLNWVDLFAPHWERGVGRLTTELRRLLPLDVASAPPAVRLTTHTAVFNRSPVPRYFLNVTSQAKDPLSITHAWFEADRHRISVAPKSRPLPQLLHPGETWSTWIEVDRLPPAFRDDAFLSFRVSLADDTVVSSTRRTTVPPRGTVAGGPILDEDISLTPMDPTSPAVTGSPAPDREGGYQAFWQAYLDQVRDRHPDWTRASRAPSDNYMYQPCSLDGCRLAPGFKRDGRLSHELVIMTKDGDRNLEIFHALHNQQVDIEGIYGRPLVWDPRPGVKRCLIGEYRPGTIQQTADHNQYINWFLDCGDRLRRAISITP